MPRKLSKKAPPGGGPKNVGLHTGALPPVTVGLLSVLAAGWLGGSGILGQEVQSSRLRFRHHLIDVGLEGRGVGQTALVDLTGDGRPEFVLGVSGGKPYVYQFERADRWTRYTVGDNSPSEVGLATMDVDGDGRVDLVAGGAWYRNGGDLSRPFERFGL